MRLEGGWQQASASQQGIAAPDLRGVEIRPEGSCRRVLLVGREGPRLQRLDVEGRHSAIAAGTEVDNPREVLVVSCATGEKRWL